MLWIIMTVIQKISERNRQRSHLCHHFYIFSRKTSEKLLTYRILSRISERCLFLACTCQLPKAQIHTRKKASQIVNSISSWKWNNHHVIEEMSVTVRPWKSMTMFLNYVNFETEGRVWSNWSSSEQVKKNTVLPSARFLAKSYGHEVN